MRLLGSNLGISALALVSCSLLTSSLLACALSDDQLGSGSTSRTTGDGDPSEAESGNGDGDGDSGGTESAGNSAGEGQGDGDGDGDGGGDGDGDGEPCGPYPTTEVPECVDIIGEGFCSEGGGHVDIGTEIMWMHEPPMSGQHFPVWSSWGEKNQPVERGYWVHNIEHGGIVLIYNCANNCMQDVNVLRDVLAARPDLSILLTPDPLLEGSTFAAISWTWVYTFEQPVLEDLLCFVDQHYDHAPESVL